MEWCSHSVVWWLQQPLKLCAGQKESGWNLYSCLSFSALLLSASPSFLQWILFSVSRCNLLGFTASSKHQVKGLRMFWIYFGVCTCICWDILHSHIQALQTLTSVFLPVSSPRCRSNLTRGVGRFREILRAVENRTTQSLRMVRDGLRGWLVFYVGLRSGYVLCITSGFPFDLLKGKVWHFVLYVHLFALLTRSEVKHMAPNKWFLCFGFYIDIVCWTVSFTSVARCILLSSDAVRLGVSPSFQSLS